ADIVIQAAATTSGAKDIVSRPHIHVTDNAVMNSLLFRSAFEHKVRRFLFFSCTTMYQSSATPQKEDDFVENEPFNEKYFGSGWTKVYLEKMCEFFSSISETHFTVIRHSNIYGPHDKYDLERSHVFGATVTKVMTSTDDRVVVWGRGEEARDLLYISDLIDFVRLAVENDIAPYRIYNVGSGAAVKIKELVKRIVEASGRPLRIEHDLSKPTIETSLSLDTTRASEELGWQPRVPLDEGIEMTLDWYRETFRGELPE
ncbi:MAG: NAD-dependent epimerase/dehydratase family protein, partial [Verrucomicrobia bacterium]|nr:NAD-dependent epimerase/dehydratase family protein [Verrucomicrobiota bacterium]